MESCNVDFFVGTDCEDIDRWRRLLSDLDGNGASMFFPEEHVHCRSFDDPAPHYAGRWCAKEAVVKALFPLMPLTVREVKIVSSESGMPQVELRLPESFCSKVRVKVSISHSATTAMACAFALVLPDSPAAAPGSDLSELQ